MPKARLPGGLGVSEHKSTRVEARCAVLTVSDTRTLEDDSSGALLRQRLASAGHRIEAYEILPDEPQLVTEKVLAWVGLGLDVVVVSGGTGIAPRDRTYEAIVGVLERRLDGFGELFRALSFAEIGSAAMLSRAVAGVVGSTIVFSVPGSTAACALAMDRLILPELSHIANLLRSTPGGAAAP